MENQNGIHIFTKEDSLPPLPQGLSADIPVRSKFGFKVVEAEGKAYLEAATETDYRTAEAQRLGVKPEEVSITGQCVQTGPQNCDGYCASAGICTLAYNPQGGHYYCTCR